MGNPCKRANINAASNRSNSVLSSRTLSLKFMDNFLFFICHLSSDLAAGAVDTRAMLHKSFARAVLNNMNRNIHGSRRRNRRAKYPFYLMQRGSRRRKWKRHHKFSRKLKFISDHFHISSRKWVTRNMLSSRKKRVFYTLPPRDKRSLILTLFTRSLMHSVDAYVAYSGYVCVLSDKFHNLHSHIDSHGLALSSDMLRRPVSALFKH
jgi:hypothetical protein